MSRNRLSGGMMFDQRGSAPGSFLGRFAGGTFLGSLGIAILGSAIFLSFHHSPYASASDSGPLATNMIRSAPDFNWRQSPSSVLSSAGTNSVTLDPCPPGVIAAEPAYYVYISGTGMPEAVRVTGGSCKGRRSRRDARIHHDPLPSARICHQQRVWRNSGSVRRCTFHPH